MRGCQCSAFGERCQRIRGTLSLHCHSSSCARTRRPLIPQRRLGLARCIATCVLRSEHQDYTLERPGSTFQTWRKLPVTGNRTIGCLDFSSLPTRCYLFIEPLSVAYHHLTTPYLFTSHHEAGHRMGIRKFAASSTLRHNSTSQ